MADPANKTFEDFERSTQGGGQSECPLGYGNEPQAQQVTYSGRILKDSSEPKESLKVLILTNFGTKTCWYHRAYDKEFYSATE